MRLFYQAFPNRDALRHELSWTHYRLLLRVDSATAREWYMNEAATQNWNTQESVVSNLYNVIQFYRAFPNLDAMRLNLSWTDLYLTTFSYDSHELVSWVSEFRNQIVPTQNSYFKIAGSQRRPAIMKIEGMRVVG